MNQTFMIDIPYEPMRLRVIKFFAYIAVIFLTLALRAEENFIGAVCLFGLFCAVKAMLQEIYALRAEYEMRDRLLSLPMSRGKMVSKRPPN